MSLHRIVRCDEPGCGRVFRGSRPAASRAGWSRIGNSGGADRCPTCREQIGSRKQGVENPRARLREGDVIEIRRAAAGGALHTELARRFGVSDSQIQRIVTGAVWAHVGVPTAPGVSDAEVERMLAAIKGRGRGEVAA